MSSSVSIILLHYLRLVYYRNTVPEDPTVPQRPPGERPESQRMAGGMGAFGPGGLAGYPQIVANIGLFPSLFGLAFVSTPTCPPLPWSPFLTCPSPAACGAMAALYCCSAILCPTLPVLRMRHMLPKQHSIYYHVSAEYRHAANDMLYLICTGSNHQEWGRARQVLQE